MFVRSCLVATASVILAIGSAAVAVGNDDLSVAYLWLLGHPDKKIQYQAECWRELTEKRRWSDSTDRYAVEAGYVDHSKGTVTLQKPDGTRIAVPIEKLDEKSKEMLKEIRDYRPQILAALEHTREYRKLMVSRGGKPVLRPGHPPQPQQSEGTPKSREDKLAALSEEEKAVSADYNGVVSNRRTDLSRLETKLDRIRKARQTPRSRAAAKELEEQREKLASAVEEVKSRSKKTATEFEQRRRRIVFENPQMGDPKYVEMAGRFYTKEEAEQAKRLQAERGSPRAAADAYLRKLIAQGDVDRATFRGMTHLGQTRITTGPDSPVMTGTKVHYQVVYTSPAGLVITRNAAVMTLQGEDGWWYVPMLHSVYGRVSSNGLLLGQ